MKRMHLFAGAALAAFLSIVPTSLTSAQSGADSAGAGATTGVGGGVGGQYGGATPRTYGSTITNQNLNGTNLNNAGAADRYRGQGLDQFGDGRANMTAEQASAARSDAAFRSARSNNARTSNAPNFSRNQSNDANFSRREAMNDNDRFQSDPYQSATTSDQAAEQREEWLERRRQDYADRRRYQRDRYDDRQSTTTFVPVPSWGWGGGADGFAVSGEYAGPVQDVPVDPYASGYTGPGGAGQLPRHNIWTPRHIQRNWAQHQWGSQYEGSMIDEDGVPPRDRSRSRMTPARKQSMDRAANHVNANRGRDLDSLNEEVPADEAIDTARQIDARVDPRGR